MRAVNALGWRVWLVFAAMAVPLAASAQERSGDDKTKIDQQAAALEERAVGSIRAGRPADAIALLDQAIAVEEKAHAGEMRQLFCARSVPESVSYLLETAAAKKDAVVFTPAWCDAIYLKGYSLIDAGRLDEAKTYLERAVQMAPSNAQYLGELGEWYKSRRNWADAYTSFQRAADAAALSPEPAKKADKGRGMRGMGFVLGEQGKFDEAEKLYRQCLELDPNDASAKNELAYIAQQRAKARPPGS